MASSKADLYRTNRARGLELLRQVYAELHRCLGDDHSPAELLRAAQSLIDISNREYSSNTFQDEIHYPGYYSYPVDSMIGENPWMVFANESINDLDDDGSNMSWDSLQKLRRFYRPDIFHPFVDADLSA